MNKSTTVEADAPQVLADAGIVPKSSFWYLIATQFQGAFSDNAYKFVITLAAGPAWISLIAGVFVSPFLLFTMYGGFLADRYSKRSVTVGTKIAEVVIMALAALAFWRAPLGFSVAVLFLMGAQSAFFGASKYGILPELLPEKKLSWGNGVLELTTFVAIILGTVAGGLLHDLFSPNLHFCGLVLVALALVGWCTSLRIAPVSAARPGAPFRWNFLPDIFRALARAKQDRVLWLAILGNTYFWFLGLLFQLNIIIFGQTVLELSGTKVGLLQAILAIGIGLGSYLAGVLSHNKIEYGLIPLGSLGMTILSLALSIPGWAFAGASICVAALGFSAGFFAVPVNALIQHQPPRETRGVTIAAANWLTFVSMLLASGFHGGLVKLGASPSQIFLIGALATIGVTAYLCWLLPDTLVRFARWARQEVGSRPTEPRA